MDYISTRGRAPVSFRTALEQGLAPDGGLYVPNLNPEDGWPTSGPGASLADRLAPFVAPEIGLEAGRELVAETLSFEVPLVPLEGDLHLLELVHGPSAAFKDVGARFLARALGASAGTPSDSPPRTVLVATSGDTGGAVAAAFHGVPGVRVVVLFPAGGVTPLQRRQFTTLGANVAAVAVPGPFDACQALVKQALSDPELRERYRLTSANSINIGRLLPQMLYYWHAVDQLRALGESRPPVFVVPSGNLGNVGAGMMAARSGIPGARFVAALNRNDALARWLGGHEPDPQAPTHATPSSAMDVARPSNLERLRWLAGNDPASLSDVLSACVIDDDETRAMIGEARERWGQVVCPHTAVGLRAAEQLRDEAGSGPRVVLATAHAAKFGDIVGPILGREPALPEALRARLEAPEEVAELPDLSLAAVRAALEASA
jgi:threonine synthase